MGNCCDNSDTIKLLKECDAGSKMAVTSIDDVLDDVQDEKLKKTLIESKDHHTKLGNEIHEQLNKNCADEKAGRYDYRRGKELHTVCYGRGAGESKAERCCAKSYI